MRLTELNPRWIGRDSGFTADPNDGGCGLAFACPHCRKVTIAVHFDKPLDGGPGRSPQHCWHRTAGATFETLTLAPSIDHSTFEADGTRVPHWHGYIVDGEIRTC